eukprot:CAMPEP_0202447430 /NCGR_PEP_ID=MMETSP1360-20130828/6188_1 /ASSEMBLY_ACC=CAM_ASM_000848 /TAXON_ID=515479 /ORGANISM="Licmophora paradoxa, Strain CCMP2313" /LENGTH=166 /DNA_ID=CAMNT_0049064515 /DNA_START=14 /DNA_END=514 /DNA_ORIENTATION=-
MASEINNGTDSAAARKRRKEIMLSLRESNKAVQPINDFTAPPRTKTEDLPSSPTGEPLPPKKRKIPKNEQSEMMNNGAIKTTVITNDKKKTQIRYDPETPMDKDQLAAWRREARRVRNRESAAASRQRIRDRINELESEVEDWKKKYMEAAAQLEDIQHGVDTDLE